MTPLTDEEILRIAMRTFRRYRTALGVPLASKLAAWKMDRLLREAAVVVSAAPEFTYCPDCDVQVEVLDRSEEQIGYEEQAREVHVTRLDCGHDKVVPLRRRWTS